MGSTQEKIAPYQNRFGRTRPVIAVIGENSGTEMTDYVIPYSILTESAVADVFALAIQPGTVKMSPTSLKLVPQASAEQFDARYPDGADYVIVPAVAKSDEPALRAWIAAQGNKGATIVSICDGAFAVAHTGMMKGRRATAHWYTDEIRRQKFLDTRWLRNARYVVDGSIVSSAGISAALPTSLALVEAIAGYDRALSLAALHGVKEWGPQHNSDAFVPRFGVNLKGYVTTMYTNEWFYKPERIGVPVSPGMDDIAFVLTMDAYSRTGRSLPYAAATGNIPFVTRNGLTFIADQLSASASGPERMLPAIASAPVPEVFEHVLTGISALYGESTASGVAYGFEYPRVEK